MPMEMVTSIKKHVKLKMSFHIPGITKAPNVTPLRQGPSKRDSFFPLKISIRNMLYMILTMPGLTTGAALEEELPIVLNGVLSVSQSR